MAEGFDYVIPGHRGAGRGCKTGIYPPDGTDAGHGIATGRKTSGAGESANEDARFVLPNAAATRLVVTMNARELMHFFSLRCCNRAQWEIREMAWQMLALCKQAAPALFEHAGACLRIRPVPGRKEHLWESRRGEGKSPKSVNKVQSLFLTHLTRMRKEIIMAYYDQFLLKKPPQPARRLARRRGDPPPGARRRETAARMATV